MGEVYGEDMSLYFFFFLPLDVGFFACSMCRSHSTSFWNFFQRDFFMHSYRFGVSMGGSEFKSHLRPINLGFNELIILKLFL